MSINTTILLLTNTILIVTRWAIIIGHILKNLKYVVQPFAFYEIVWDYIIHVEDPCLELCFIIYEAFRGDFLKIGYSLNRVLPLT